MGKPVQAKKLFSNPISGIACYFDPKSNYDLAHGVQYHINGIKYSKSMLLNALYFWEKQYNKYKELVKRAQFNPIFKKEEEKENELLKTIVQVLSMPSSFLFSHRYIEIVGRLDYEPLQIQRKLLEKKYPDLGIIWFEKQTLQPIASKEIKDLGIQFSIFLNEHPYIQRSKIAEVGKTKKGNTFVVKKL